MLGAVIILAVACAALVLLVLRERERAEAWLNRLHAILDAKSLQEYQTQQTYARRVELKAKILESEQEARIRVAEAQAEAGVDVQRAVDAAKGEGGMPIGLGPSLIP